MISNFMVHLRYKYVGKVYPENQLSYPKHLIDSTVNTRFHKKILMVLFKFQYFCTNAKLKLRDEFWYTHV